MTYLNNIQEVGGIVSAVQLQTKIFTHTTTHESIDRPGFFFLLHELICKVNIFIVDRCNNYCSHIPSYCFSLYVNVSFSFTHDK